MLRFQSVGRLQDQILGYVTPPSQNFSSSADVLMVLSLLLSVKFHVHNVISEVLYMGGQISLHIPRAGRWHGWA